MKRLVPIALACLVLLCVGSTIAGFMYIQAGAGAGELPVYPGAQNVHRGSAELVPAPSAATSGITVKGSGFLGDPAEHALQFETSDPVANVHDYYDSWLGSHGWTVSGTSGGSPVGAPLMAHKVGSPDWLDVRFLGFSGSLIPRFIIPAHLYMVIVNADGSSGITKVTIDLIELGDS